MPRDWAHGWRRAKSVENVTGEKSRPGKEVGGEGCQGCG